MRCAVCRAPRLLLLLFALAASICFATSATAEGVASSNPSSTSPPASPAAPSALPELSDLNEEKPEDPFYRFEIVSLGSYPITLFYAGLVLDFERYYENGFNSAYIPLASDDSLTDNDRWVRLGAALCVSCVVGAIDAIIHYSKVKAAERLQAAEAVGTDDATGAAAKAKSEPASSSP